MRGFTREFALRADQLAVLMIKWLTNLFDGVRIGFAYFSYEEECRKQWVADANRTYSTAQVEQYIKDRMAEPLCHVSCTYDAPIRELESKRENVRRVVADAKEKLAILERDYKTELECAYKAQNETREELNECLQNLSGAYDDLNSAKRKLDSWYSKAEGNWFGNGGKQLPKHAFFGQDLSDRDHYKSERDSAARAVGRYKAERSRIGCRLDEARATVQRTKAARQAMFDLKKAGFDKRIVTSAINNGNNDLHSIGEEIAQLAKSRDDYVHRAKESLGVYALEAEISRLRQERDVRIKEFDSESVMLERKAKHRVEWLAERGR